MTLLTYSTSKEGTFVHMGSEDKNLFVTNDEIEKGKGTILSEIFCLNHQREGKEDRPEGPAFLAYVLQLILFPSKVADHNIAGYLLHTSDRSHPTSRRQGIQTTSLCWYGGQRDVLLSSI